MIMQLCTKCGETKPLTEEYFYRGKACKNGFQRPCIECKMKHQGKYYIENRDRLLAADKERRVKEKLKPDYDSSQRHAQIKYRYGLEPEQYQAMVDKQGNCCAICKETFTETPRIDHDHNCCGAAKACDECRRGLLCDNCNTSLGKFKDSPVILHAAIEYLMRWAA